MIKNLYIIRHGQADHLVGERYTGGWTNSLLTELGKKQARSTGQRLSKLLVDGEFDFFCSDLERARETARIIGNFIGAKPVPVMALRELNNGAAANLTTEEAKKIALPMTEPMIDWIHYPNAESWRDMTNRVFGFMNAISEGCRENVIIVSHRGIVVTIIDWWLELNENYINKISYDIDPCSITYLRVNKWGERTISKMNDTAHIERLLYRFSKRKKNS